MESAGSVELVVERTGNTLIDSFVKYESIDGTATGGDDYEKVSLGVFSGLNYSS